MTARPIVSCPKCRRSLRLPEAAEGRTIKCPACGEIFRPAPVSAPEEAITLPLAEAPQAIRPTRPTAAANPVGRRPSPAEDEDISVVEPIGEEISAGVRAASSKGFSFIVAIQRDPRKQLKGRFQGQLTTAGLQLQQGKKEPILLPRGCGAEYLGGNRLSVTVEDAAVVLTVSRRLAGYQNRLARDVAAYLNGDLAHLPIDNYSLPWYLTTLVLLPLAIPILTLGGLVPALIGAMGLAINAVIAQRENWPMPLRVILAAAVVCLAYLGLIVFLVGMTIWRAGGKVDSSPLAPRQHNVVNMGGGFQPNLPPQDRMPLAPVPKEEVLPPGVRLLARAPDRRPMDQAEGMLLAVVFTQNGAELIAASNTANVYHWDIAGGTLKGKVKLDVPDALTGFDVTPDGKTAAACANTGPTFLFDFPSGQKRATLIDLKNFASWSVAFAPDGQYLASAHGDGKVRLWDTERGTLRKAINAHGNQILPLAFSRDGKYLASASSWTLEAKIWEMPAGTQLAAFDVEKRLGNVGGISGVHTLALTPDGAVLASGGSDRVIRLWDARSGHLRTELPPQNNLITALGFSPDGRLLASSSSGDSQIRLWDAATGKPRSLRQERALRQAVGGRGGGEIAFSPDGKTLAISRDVGVELWDLSQVLQP
jgi:hypothetical protein